jgi:two-component system chemotaxis response regulator CheB
MMGTMKNSLPRSIDILVVDDSAVVRQSLKEIIEKEPAFRVLVAADPYEAVTVMSKVKPKAIVLDVDMPRMDGLTFLRKLMRQHPLPVLLVTDHPARGVAALEFGALEVIAKPDWHHVGDLDAWGLRLRDSLSLAINRGETRLPEEARIEAEPRLQADVVLPRRPYQPQGAPSQQIIALGASTGGVQAILRVLTLLPRETPGIVIVQHMRDGFMTAFAERLGNDTKIAMSVREAKHGQQVVSGQVLIVPEGKHGVVRRSPNQYYIELIDGPLVSRFRPSVDVLFRSVAQAAGPNAAGVILTGMLDDGAAGLLEMREAGAWTIAQDEHSSQVFGMNKEAIRRGAVRKILALDRIPAELATWARTSIRP